MRAAIERRPEGGIRGLRILAFCDYFSPSSCGGSERVALEVYRRLAGFGAEIEVVTAMSPGMAPPDDVPGIRVNVVPSLDLTRLLRAQVALAPKLFGAAAAAARRFQPDLLHANTLYFQSSLAAARQQRASGLPLVTTVQIGTVRHLPQPVRSLTRSYEKTIGRVILGRSTRVIAVSESVRAHLISLGVPAAKIDVVFNGVDLDRFSPGSAVAKVHAVPTIIFVGRLTPNKGPQVLLDALERLHGHRVAFRAEYVGDGPLRSQLERRARASGLAESVSFRGQVDDIAPRLKEADVLVRPSFTEGLPLAVLEAMASGVCVVASDIPGNRDLIRDQENGLTVGVGNAAALAQTLRRLILDPSLRARLGAAGHKTARQYSWDRSAADTIQVLAAARSHEQVVLSPS